MKERVINDQHMCPSRGLDAIVLDFMKKKKVLVDFTGHE